MGTDSRMVEKSNIVIKNVHESFINVMTDSWAVIFVWGGRLEPR